MSTFEVIEHQITYLFNPNTVVQQALEQRYAGYSQFGNNGVLAVLQRLGASNLIIFGSHAASKVSHHLADNVAIF